MRNAFALFLLFGVAFGCGGDGEVAAPGPVVSTLGPSGGSAVLSMGVEISAPAGALTADVTFSAAQVPPPSPLPAGVTPVGSAVDIRPSDDLVFDRPVKVTMSYGDAGMADESAIQVLHWDSASTRWEPVTVLSRDAAANRIQFSTRVFSPFLPVRYEPSSVPLRFSVPGFRPAVHGWSIGNTASYWTFGNCLGMAAYATWFFDAYPELSLSTAHVGESAQEVATRAHLSQSNLEAGFETLYKQSLSQIEIGRQLKFLLSATRLPQVVVLRGESSAHAVVAYGFDENRILVYDVNFPGQSHAISFKDAAGYSTYSYPYAEMGGVAGFGYLAMPSLGRKLDFEVIRKGALTGFANPPFPRVSITSHADGDTVDGFHTTLKGTAGANGGPAPDSVVVFVKGTAVGETRVVNGSFSFKIPIASGRNSVAVYAGKVDASQARAQWLPQMGARRITLKGSRAAAPLLVTLMWDQADTDVDLYVTELKDDRPVETAWYRHKKLASGAYLDFDNTTGYGPEHFVVPKKEMLRDDFYAVRVHYYRRPELSGATVDCTVMIVINEGTDRQKFETVSFTLAAADPDNHEPLSEGPDWWNGASVHPKEGIISLPPAFP